MNDKTILLVDDKKPVLLSLSNYLEKNEYSVQSVMSGQEALDLFRSSPFDLVITDIVMNGINGIETLREIKKINYETGVFILTGHANLELAIEALRAGADDFFIKPCDTDELLIKMGQFFGRQEILRKIKIYERYLPICMYCKRIRDDSGREPGKGDWIPLEEYLCQKSGSDITHGCCPECFKEFMADLRKSN